MVCLKRSANMSMHFQSSIFTSEFPGVQGLFVIVAPCIVGSRPASPLTLAQTLRIIDALIFRGRPSSFDKGINALNLRQTIEKAEHERAGRFFDPAILERVGRRAGKRNFVADLIDMMQVPERYAGREGRKQKLQMLQFISDQYNDHIGAPRMTVKLFKGENPDLRGFYRPFGSTIYVNENSPAFANDFAGLVKVIVHENTHNAQANPNVYSDPRLSRIYRANFRAYRNAEQHGRMAYRWQPVEIGAFAAGDMAEHRLRSLAATNDNRPGFARKRSHPFQYAA
jgi:hypothetical protein